MEDYVEKSYLFNWFPFKDTFNLLYNFNAIFNNKISSLKTFETEMKKKQVTQESSKKDSTKNQLE